MSFRDLERAVWGEAKVVFNNRSLRLKDIIEWSNSEERVKANSEEGEVVAVVPMGFWVCVLTSNDKRKAAEAAGGDL